MSKNKRREKNNLSNTTTQIELPIIIDNVEEKVPENDSVVEEQIKIDENIVIKQATETFKLEEDKTEQLELFDLDEIEGKGINNTLMTLIFEVLYIFLVEILFKVIFGNTLLDWSVLRIFSSSLILGGILAIATCKLRLLKKIILSVLNFGIALYAVLQLGFMDFLGTFISLGSAEQGTKITDYIGDFILSINPKDYLIFILFAISILYFVFEKKITGRGYGKSLDFKKVLTYVEIVTFFAGSSLIFYMTLDLSFMQNKFQTVSNKELFKYASNPAIAIKNFGTTTYLLLDIKSVIMPMEAPLVNNTDTNSKENEVTIDENARTIDDTAWNRVIEEENDSTINLLNNYYINREITRKNDYTGMFEGKNLIMVMLESVAFAPFTENYKEYFPTLYKLQSEGISAINNYSPKNNCATGESEMTSVLSLYSIETTCTVNTYRKNVYPEALLSMFKNNGYYTSAYHDYTDQYYYRSVYEKNFGAVDYYGVTGLGMTYNPLYKEWPSDKLFVEKALPKFIDKDHFASYMISVTSHAPYMYSSEWGDEYLSLFKDLNIDKTAKRYLSKIKVVDLALEELLKELESAGKLDDTVIVLFGDHYPYALSSKQFASIAPYDTSTNQEVDRTPFIIYNSATPHETIEKLTSPLDYTPTLLNMFGIDYDPRLYMGHDIFSDYEDYVIFPDNSWQTPAGFYNTSKGEYTPYENAETVMSDEDIIKMNSQVSELRNMSNLAIKKNYFKTLFEKLESANKAIEEENIDEEKTEEKED